MIKKFNEWLAVHITLALGTMWCTYVFALLVLIPVFVPRAEQVIMYISSSFLQLVCLPLLMVGQNVLSRKSEKRAEEDHKMIMKELRELRNLRLLVEARLPKPKSR